jgi:hypothetical protein
MSLNVREKEEQQKNNLVILLWKEKKEELVKILTYWEKIKEQWEKKKKEFRSNRENSLEFDGLLDQYEKNKREFIEWLTWEWKKVLENLKWVTKEKFIDEYFHDTILYTKTQNYIEPKIIECSYEDLIKWNIEVKKHVILVLSPSNIWVWWAEEIQKKIANGIELVAGVASEVVVGVTNTVKAGLNKVKNSVMQFLGTEA